jgi:hypothetical protein
MYKLINDHQTGKLSCVMRINSDGSTTSFGEDPANTDYQQFRKDIANGVQLEDANNNIMTANQITTFVATLP